MEQSRKKAREDRKKQQKKKNQRNIFLVIIGSGLVFVALIFIIPRIPALINVPVRDYPNPVDNAMGDPDAPVTLVDFSDYQCSHCKNYYDSVEEQIITDYVETGKVYYIYRSFGAALGPESLGATEAAYCAAYQGKFWEYHDILFANYSTGNDGGYSTWRLQAFAKKLGLDIEAFNACLESDSTFERIQQDVDDAQAAGISGTPSFLINGELQIAGYVDYATFKTYLDQAIEISQ